MKKSQLYQVYQLLNAEELRALRKVVRSPFFNKRTDVSHLFDYLYARKEHSDKYLDKKRVFKYLFPQQTYKDSMMRYAMSFLLQVIKEFVTISEMRKQNIEEQLYWTKFLRQRGAEKLCATEIKNTHQILQKEGKRNAVSHFYQYQLHLENYTATKQTRRSGDMNLQELSDELTSFYISEVLQHSCNILSHQTMFPKSYNVELLEAVIAQVQQGKYENQPAITLYYYAYMALTNEDSILYFNKLKKLLEEYWQQFSEREMRDVFLLAINYCIKKLNSGEQIFIKEAFELYQSGLEKGVLLEQNVLSRFTYNNVLLLGLALDKVAWGSAFLETYKPFLPEKERDNIYQYNLSVYYFRTQDYEQAMQLLREVEFQDILYQLDARRMLLRIYYELNEVNALLSLLDSFEKFIYRQKNLGYHQNNYLNLIRLLRKMLSNPLEDKEIRAKLKAEALSKNALAEREWVLTQLSD